MSPLPLEGVKVLDLSRLLPGGFCSLLMADFGADVLGEHTADVLRDAGYDDEAIERLVQAGAVAGPAREQQGSFLGG